MYYLASIRPAFAEWTELKQAKQETGGANEKVNSGRIYQGPRQFKRRWRTKDSSSGKKQMTLDGMPKRYRGSDWTKGCPDGNDEKELREASNMRTSDNY